MTASLRPRPPVLLLATSSLVLAACLFLIAVTISLFANAWDPCSVCGGLILLPLPLALAVQQYRATFRQNQRAALISAVILFFVGGLSIVVLATAIGEWLIEGDQPPWLPLVATMLSIAAIAILAGMADLFWWRRLRQAPPASDGTTPIQFSIREMLAGAAAAACILGIATYFIRATPPRYAEHVPPERAPFTLPETARDVSFCRGYRGTNAYEFTIEEPDFVAWMNSRISNLELQQSNSAAVRAIAESYTIYRYCSLAPELTGPDSITITNGLYYEWSKEDRGVHAAFDRDSGRAYYFAHYH